MIFCAIDSRLFQLMAFIPVEAMSHEEFPQGSLLGLALFFLYTYGIRDKILSNMHLYADDGILCTEVYSIDRDYSLQQDLDTLSE